MENRMNIQSGKELLKKAIEQWADDGLLDSYNGEKSFSGQRMDGADGDTMYYNLEKDPVINLFMTALAHQTNLLKEQISTIQASLLDEFVRKTIPYTLTRPVPSMTVLQAKMADTSEYSYMVDDATTIQLEKRTKTKMRFNESEKFSFLPLLKTKILSATVSSVRKTARNSFEVTISGKSIVDNLSGISLFFPRHASVSLGLSLDGVSLPVISVSNYEQMPLCDIFNVNHCVFNRSLLYGSTESWMDRMAPLNGKLFYIGQYEGVNNSSAITLQMTLSLPNDATLTDQDVLINCIPLVNVEKGSVFLSTDEPIKRIAAEKTIESQEKKESLNVSDVKKERMFLHLLAPEDQAYNPDQITLRHFGAERFHIGDLIAQTNALIHRYSSDYYAFKTFADLNFDDQMNQLRKLLNEIGQIINQDNQASSGVYVMLQRPTLEFAGNTSSGITVSYLLTDGQRGNGITPDATIKLPPMLDESESVLLSNTFGGRDEMRDSDSLKLTASYYHLSKDRLITKSDIKYFCYKELLSLYRIPKTAVQDIFFRQIVHNSRQIMCIEIVLNLDLDQDFNEDMKQYAALMLQRKINNRTTGFCEYVVRIGQQ